jgi:hypothetical protein
MGILCVMDDLSFPESKRDLCVRRGLRRDHFLTVTFTSTAVSSPDFTITPFRQVSGSPRFQNFKS